MAWETYQKYMSGYPKWFTYIYFGVLTVLNSGCTYSIIMNHTEGQATDVVDETQGTTPTVSPTVTIPKSVGTI